jgi:hypothetical protein
VLLLAHLDCPVPDGLAVEGNLRVEGWAFWMDDEGKVQQPQLSLKTQGGTLPCRPLAVPRPDVNAAHGLGDVTPPLGFRFLLQSPWPEGGIRVEVELETGQCTLALLQRQPAEAALDDWLTQGLQQHTNIQLPPRPTAGATWNPDLLAQLGEGPHWDGSTAAAPEALRQHLTRDLGLIRQMLQSGHGSGQSSALLAALAHRYGLPLLEQLMAGLNRQWLASQQLEFTQHGVQRTFRYWSAVEKAEAMAISTEALLRWQAACHPPPGARPCASSWREWPELNRETTEPPLGC